MRHGAPCYLVRNGIDKDVFPVLEHAPLNTDGPLRVLIEGSPSSWFKHVHDAINAASAMREPHHVTVVCGDRDALGEVVADDDRRAAEPPRDGRAATSKATSC